MSAVVSVDVWGRRGVVLLRVVGVLVCPFVLAGCAAGMAPASVPAVSGSVAAQRLLRDIVLPAGAGPLVSRGAAPTAFQSDDLDCPGLVEREQYWRVPGLSIAAAQAWFEQHASHGLRVGGKGSGGDRFGETMTEVDYVVGRDEAVSAGSRLVVEAVADATGSAVRASAQVVPATGCASTAH